MHNKNINCYFQHTYINVKIPPPTHAWRFDILNRSINFNLKSQPAYRPAPCRCAAVIETLPANVSFSLSRTIRSTRARISTALRLTRITSRGSAVRHYPGCPAHTRGLSPYQWLIKPRQCAFMHIYSPDWKKNRARRPVHDTSDPNTC